ncbi:lanthionine synthetase LanC family protein [Mucilaginibacter sabulilitoris]|uniref:Lanthionine synthetase LanC family protein n=1 Tax=Mucilaginibacter sabulilitoris TaxID=1173583 RepID=A0ABZ0TQ00_9SPHI|nr:lanthionine synthetase LanC family protein [Mucilaginibacter sabulilitoris]WPU95220.1 lanthionine synthetase LanC family protein [Mucilaginibacter sabulilitoris]
MTSLKRIEDWLERYEDNFTNNYGLHYGKTGLMMVYFKLFEISKNHAYQAKARLFIDDLSEHIESVKDTSFEHGLAGIGWAIEWMAQNKFIDADTNEVLEDMDDELYKSIVYAEPSKESGLSNYIGKGLYFYRRLKSKNMNSKRYRTICNQECLNLMTDKVCETLNAHNKNLHADVPGIRQQDIASVARSLVFLSMINNASLNTDHGKNLICETSEAVSGYLDSKIATGQFVIADLQLIYAYSKTGQLLNDRQYGETVRKALTVFQPKGQLSTVDRLILMELIPNMHANIFEDTNIRLKLTISNIIKMIGLEQSSARSNWEEGVFI